MRSLIPLAAAAVALAACQKTEPSPAAQADLARGDASTGAAGAVTGTSDPNPSGAGATTGAATSDTTAQMKSTSPDNPAGVAVLNDVEPAKPVKPPPR
jgi:hypothetical protein